MTMNAPTDIHIAHYAIRDVDGEPGLMAADRVSATSACNCAKTGLLSINSRLQS
jgi:hypothetical protein